MIKCFLELDNQDISSCDFIGLAFVTALMKMVAPPHAPSDGWICGRVPSQDIEIAVNKPLLNSPAILLRDYFLGWVSCEWVSVSRAKNHPKYARITRINTKKSNVSITLNLQYLYLLKNWQSDYFGFCMIPIVHNIAHRSYAARIGLPAISLFISILGSLWSFNRKKVTLAFLIRNAGS